MTPRKVPGGKCFVCDEVGHFARDCPQGEGGLGFQSGFGDSSNDKVEGEGRPHSWRTVPFQPEPRGVSENLPWRNLLKLDGTWMNWPRRWSWIWGVCAMWLGFKGQTMRYESDSNGNVGSEFCPRRRFFVLGMETHSRVGTCFKWKPRLEGRGFCSLSVWWVVHVLLYFPNNPTLSWKSSSNHTLSSRRLKVKNYGLQETKAGHYTVSIDELGLLEDSWNPPRDFVMVQNAEVTLTWHAKVFGSKLDHPDEERDPSLWKFPSATRSNADYAGRSDTRHATIRRCPRTKSPTDAVGRPAGGEAARREVTPGGDKSQCEKGSTEAHGGGDRSQTSRTRSASGRSIGSSQGSPITEDDAEEGRPHSERATWRCQPGVWVYVLRPFFPKRNDQGCFLSKRNALGMVDSSHRPFGNVFGGRHGCTGAGDGCTYWWWHRRA